MKPIRIGTRGSALALWQANHVKALLEKNSSIPVELTIIKTSGDKILDVPLAEIGGKGLFLKEIEEALLSQEVDLAVHSMKDVPAELPEGLTLVSILEREDPRDAFISHSGKDLKSLPSGARIGTSSLRRLVQLKALRGDLVFESLRGNVDTRLKKLKEGQYDGIVLAAAGLKRLGFQELITHYLDCVPAVAQGAIGIEARTDDADLFKILKSLNHLPTQLCVEAERSFLKGLAGSCTIPLGCAVSLEGENEVSCKAFYQNSSGKILNHQSRLPLSEAAPFLFDLACRWKSNALD